MPDMKLFAKRVKECRESMGLSLRELGAAIGTSAANISRWETGKHGAGRDALADLANVFNVNPAWLMGSNVEKYLDNKAQPKKIPIVGTIAAGYPLLAEENIDGYIFVDDTDHVDFCLRVQGDSMINAGIEDGATVCIRKQAEVENGEIAAVLIDGEEATLKRVFILSGGGLLLHAENKKYKDMVIEKKDLKDVLILGKAVWYKQEVR